MLKLLAVFCCGAELGHILAHVVAVVVVVQYSEGQFIKGAGPLTLSNSLNIVSILLLRLHQGSSHSSLSRSTSEARVSTAVTLWSCSWARARSCIVEGAALALASAAAAFTARVVELVSALATFICFPFLPLVLPLPRSRATHVLFALPCLVGNGFWFNGLDCWQPHALQRPWPVDACGTSPQLYSLREEVGACYRVLPALDAALDAEFEVGITLVFDTEYVFVGRPHACDELLTACERPRLEGHCVGCSEEG